MSLPPLPAGFKLDRPKTKARTAKPSRSDAKPTGEAHDGDTFRLDDGNNARLYGVDAFELDQTGRTRSGARVPLGKLARDVLLPYAVPTSTVTPTGASTYGRPVASLTSDEDKDAALAQLQAGYGLATPEYLKSDPNRFGDYMEAERDARLNRRGAWSGSFEQPSSYRHGTPDPWAKPVAGKEGESEAVFWDDPLPAQGVRPEIAEKYISIWQDPTSTPADLLAFAKTSGFTLDPSEVEKAYKGRETRGAGSEVTYRNLPRVLTDHKDGATGAALRGVADPFNVLDEAGAVVDTLSPGTDRENLWSSDRRFGDVYANNLDQNRSILAFDDAKHPYARFAGQLAGGLVLPGMSAEGVGFAAARGVLEAGGSRYAAKLAARRAVVNRMGAAGAVEGTAAGVGQGEDWQGRVTGGLVGSVAGTALGAGAGVVAPRIAEAIGRPFSKLAGRDGERVADDFADGAVDAARARASNAASDEAKPLAGLAEQPPETGRRVVDLGSPNLGVSARKEIRQRRGLSPTEGQFGPIHYALANPKRWGEAAAKLAKDETGEIPGAVRHPEVGNIDVIYGTDDVGLKHIAAKHPEVVDDLPATIERMPVVERPDEAGNGRFVLDDGTHRAVIAPDFDGTTKRWVVASYDEKPAAGAAGDALPDLPEGLTLGEAAAVAPRPRDPVEANAPAMDEASGLGPKSVLSFVPPKGEPGVSVSNEDGQLAVAVFRDGDGVARGAAQIPLTPEARESFDGASVYVAPELRRQGVASQLYDALEREGYPIGAQSGSGDLTPDGAGFVSAWRSRAQPMENETPRPSISAAENMTALIDAEVASRQAARARPLLDPVNDDLRRAQAEGLEPRDVLARPANEVTSMDEAERIAAGRVEPVRAPNEADALERRNVPNANTGTPIPKRGPLDLVTWLRSQGGVRAQGGELAHYGIDNAPRKGVDFAGGENRFGPLVSNEGMNYDDAAERAWEAGFFPDHAERPTVAEFLDTLNATHSGNNRAFRPDDLAEVDAFEAARRQRYDVEAARENGAPLVEDRGQPVGLDDLEANAPPVQAYEEWGENAPTLAGNIRLDKLDSPQAISRALVHTNARVGGFDAATRGRITHAETERLAGELGMTADDLLKRRKGQAFNAEEALAARQILARSATDLVNMAKRVNSIDEPGEELEAAFKQAWLRHVAIQEQVSGATAEAGRALSAFRAVADARAVNRVLPSLGDVAGGTTRLKDAASMIVDNAADPAALNKSAALALKPRFQDKITELYYNSLLSGPATHAVNILSNTVTALGQLPEHAVAAGLGKAREVFQRKQVDRVLMSEVGARAIGLLQGTREGTREAARTFITGNASDAVTKMEQQTQRAIGGPIGSIIRTPTRALAAEDELFKAVARRMELSGLAVRTARTEGLKGADARARAAELLANPTDAMLSRSFDYGRYLTFQNPLGDAGRAVSKFTEAMPIFKLILPFVRTPTNILKFAIERSPGALVLKEWRRDIAKGGAGRDLAIAKVMMGTGLGATIFQLAGEGKITGGGPADPAAKALLQADGWQPYSFKVGDQYYSYSRLDPYSSIIGTAADLVDLRSHMTDKQADHAAQLVGVSILHTLSNKTWLSGLSTAVEALNDPDRNLENFQSRTLAAIAVPALGAQTARTIDPVLREARGPLDRIRSRIPGMSEDLTPKRDVFGRPIQLEGGVGPDIASPVSVTTRKNDPTVSALLDAGAHISKPLRKIGERQLTDVEYDRYQETAGRIAKPRLDALVKDGAWLALPRDDKQEAVTDLMKAARKEAKADLFAWSAPKPRRSGAKATGKGLPPLPPGFKIDPLPPLPPGLTLDR